MARAKEMGFHLQLPLGHGAAPFVPFRKFDPNRLGSTTTAEPARLGVWAEVNPKPGGIAEDFAHRAAIKTGGTPRVMPLLHRADQSGRIVLTGDETSHQIASTLAKAWDEGFDAVIIDNFTSKSGRNGSILVVKDPAQLRDPSAVFDPKKKYSRDLFATVGGLGLFAPLAFPLAKTERQPEPPAQ